MDTLIHAPRNRTAELQLIIRLVSQGYTLWTADQIPLGKLQGFVAKWQHYRLLADPAARAYRKQLKRANTHLVLEHRYNELDRCISNRELVHWLMLGTQGRDGLGDNPPHPGPVRDAANKAQRLEWMGYQLVRQPKRYATKDGVLRTEVTWTWRLSGRRYAEWEALLIAAAKIRDYAYINQVFAILCCLPIFAGIREQVKRLRDETNRMLKKVGGANLAPLMLPVMTLHKIWPDDIPAKPV